MKMPITPNRNFLKRIRKAHVYRALMKRQHAESGVRPSVSDQGRGEK